MAERKIVVAELKISFARICERGCSLVLVAQRLEYRETLLQVLKRYAVISRRGVQAGYVHSQVCGDALVVQGLLQRQGPQIIVERGFVLALRVLCARDVAQRAHDRVRILERGGDRIVDLLETGQR